MKNNNKKHVCGHCGKACKSQRSGKVQVWHMACMADSLKDSRAWVANIRNRLK